MAEKHTFTYYLTIEIDAMNDESAMKKLEGWVEPTLALKKNSDLNLSAIEFDEPEEEEGGAVEEKPSLVKAAMAKKARPELKIPEKDEFDYDNIPDWEEIGEDKPKKAKAILPDIEDDDDDGLGGLLDGLDDDEEEPEDDDDDEDWDWDDGEW
ncbi:MAG: hypothetical protein CMA57_00470 [Euryarchaeota archaeon]|jgi:hypothetical protein|nr:hypothetical protein [Euryarchaeota archaeon]|tara:strand:+ start:10514 stop:10972 length:459 start_codon:yes stop_codon:yes gene_type:complete